MSDYSVMGGNPIANSDVLGDRYNRPNSIGKRLANELTGNEHINKAYSHYQKELKSGHYAKYDVFDNEAVVTTDRGHYVEEGKRRPNQEIMHLSKDLDYMELSGSDKFRSENSSHALASIRRSPNSFVFTDPMGVSPDKLFSIGKIWSATKKLSSVENAYGHFMKHGSEFPQF